MRLCVRVLVCLLLTEQSYLPATGQVPFSDNHCNACVSVVTLAFWVGRRKVFEKFFPLFASKPKRRKTEHPSRPASVVSRPLGCARLSFVCVFPEASEKDEECPVRRRRVVFRVINLCEYFPSLVLSSLKCPEPRKECAFDDTGGCACEGNY